MTMRAEERLPRELKEALHDSGVSWHASYGSKHVKVYVDGRLFTVTPRGTDRWNRRNYAKMLAHFTGRSKL